MKKLIRDRLEGELLHCHDEKGNQYIATIDKDRQVPLDNVALCLLVYDSREYLRDYRDVVIDYFGNVQEMYSETVH